MLLAIYTEYQKDLPVMDNINARSLGMTGEVFNATVKKLLDEDLIGDVHLIWGEDSPAPMGVVLTAAYITRNGVAYVEKYFGIENGLPGPQKARLLQMKFSGWSLPELETIANRVLNEMDTE